MKLPRVPSVLTVFVLVSVVAALAATPGDLDVSFDTDGRVTTDFGGNDVIRAMAIQPNGRIVVAGSSNAGGNNNFALARYIGTGNYPGNLDGGFDGDGKVTTDFGGDDQAFAMALQSDGKIVVVGATVTGTVSHIALARYNSNGSLDTATDNTPATSFGPNGTGKVVATNTERAKAYGVSIQSDGKILVVGSGSTYDPTTNFVVMRYNSNGTIDQSFGTQEIDLGGSNDVATSVAIQSDGKILLGGYSNVAGTNDFVLMRLNGGNGPTPVPHDPDMSFGPLNSFGKVFTDFGGNDIGQSVVIQSDGRILVAGHRILNPGLGDFAMARYNGGNGPSPAPGSLDTTFGTGGKVTTDFGTGSDDLGFSAALQGDGKIVVAGYATQNAFAGGLNNFALARYHGLVATGAPGVLDATFGTGGKVTTDFGGGADIGYAVAINNLGRIIVAGRTAFGGSSNFALARYHSVP